MTIIKAKSQSWVTCGTCKLASPVKDRDLPGFELMDCNWTGYVILPTAIQHGVHINVPIEAEELHGCACHQPKD